MGPRRRPSGLAEALSNAACEWLLILLLFADSLLSFLVMRFAWYCNLEAPCFLCTRFNRFITSRLIKTGGYHDFLCGHHKIEISLLVYCNDHRNLAVGSGLCEDCLFSIDARNNNGTPNLENNLGLLLYKLGLRFLVCSIENSSYGRDPTPAAASSASGVQVRLCSCCRRPWTSREKVQKLLRLKPPPTRNDCSRNAGKPSVPLPQLPVRFRLNRRSSLKRIREKLSSSVRGQSGFGSLPRDGYTKLQIATEYDESKPAEEWIQKPRIKIRTDESNDVECPNCSTNLDRDVRGRSDLPALISLDDFPPSFGGDKFSEGSSNNNANMVEIMEPTSLVDAPLSSVASSEMANGTCNPAHMQANGHVSGKSTGKQSIHSASSEGHDSSLQPRTGSKNDSDEEQMDDLTRSNDAKDAECEGNAVQGLRRQIEEDQEHISNLYKELEEERNASAIATSEAMSMITRLQEEKASLHMEAMQYLRMMEEQAEHDVEALEKASDLLSDREKEIQDLEAELEYYRLKYPEEETVDETSTCG